MTIAIVSGNRGTAGHKSSGTSLTLTPSAALAAGNYGLLAVVVDNVGTAEGETDDVSVTDTNGDTWIKLREQTEANTAALSGVTCALFLAELNAELNGTDTITITLTANATAKGAGLAELSSTDPLVLSTGGANGTNEVAGTSYSVALSGLTSVPGLYVGMTAAENETGVVLDTAYTELAFAEIGSGVAGGSATNVIAHVGTLANTSTGDTFDSTVAGSDRATILVRLEEVAAGDVTLAGAGTGTSSGLGLLTGTVPVVGAADGTSSGLGNLTVTAAAVELAGNADGSSSGSGVLSGEVPLAGTGTGTSSGAGVLSGEVPLSGGADGTSSGAGVLSLTVTLAGEGTGTSSGLGDLTLQGLAALAGIAEGSSSGAGVLLLDVAILGGADGSSSGLGVLTGELVFAGAADGTSSGAGNLTVIGSNVYPDDPFRWRGFDSLRSG
jgi:hypothetical protein